MADILKPINNGFVASAETLVICTVRRFRFELFEVLYDWNYLKKIKIKVQHSSLSCRLHTIMRTSL